MHLINEITIYTNMSCTQHCKMCYLYGPNNKELYKEDFLHSVLPFKLFQSLVDSIIAHNNQCSFFLMGGEPMLHPKITEICAYIKSRSKSYVDINTNGIAPEEQYIQLIDKGIDRILFSVESAKAEEHDSIRGAGTFNKAINIIKSCHLYIKNHGYKTRLAFNTTITNQNYKNIHTLLDFALQLGINDIYLNLPMFVKYSDGEKSQNLIQKHLGIKFTSWKGFLLEECYQTINYEKLKKNINALLRESKLNDSVNIAIIPYGFSTQKLQKYFQSDWQKYVEHMRCPCLNYRTTVLPNGAVIPCTVFTDLCVGNIINKDIYDIWNGNQYNKFRLLAKQQLLPICYRCCDMLDESNGSTFHSFN